MYSKKLIKKESAIIVILLIMITSTAVLLWLSFEPFNEQGVDTAIIPTKDDVGKQAYVEGEILTIRKTFKGDHAIIVMELEGSENSTPFNLFIPNKNGAPEILKKYKEGDKIGAKGKVEIYNDELEIIVQKESDIKLI